AFWQRVRRFLENMGAEESDGPYELKLNTPIGDLDVSMWDADIICRFEEVVEATAFSHLFTAQACNPHTGKWNWHYNDDADTLNDDCEAQFVKHVTLLMSLDLTTLTPDQTEDCVARLSKLPLDKLRHRQELIYRKIERAFEQRNDTALANLHVRAENLR